LVTISELIKKSHRDEISKSSDFAPSLISRPYGTSGKELDVGYRYIIPTGLEAGELKASLKLAHFQSLSRRVQFAQHEGGDTNKLNPTQTRD